MSEQTFNRCPITGRSAADEINQNGTFVQTFGDYRTSYTLPILDNDLEGFHSEIFDADERGWTGEIQQECELHEICTTLMKEALPHIQNDDRLKESIEYVLREYKRVTED